MREAKGDIRPGVMAAAMLLGALLGFTLWIATDTFALFPAFVGVGLGVGLLMGGQPSG